MGEELGISMDGRRLLARRVHFTLPSTLLCIAAGTSAAAPLDPLSADSSSVKESTGTSAETGTLSSFPTGAAAAAAATAATSSAAASSNDIESYEGMGEKEGEDEAMEVKMLSDGCEAHWASDICTSPSSSSTTWLVFRS